MFALCHVWTVSCLDCVMFGLYHVWTVSCLDCIMKTTGHLTTKRWLSYHPLDQLNDGVYLHYVVINGQNFVVHLHPEIHTQNEVSV